MKLFLKKTNNKNLFLLLAQKSNNRYAAIIIHFDMVTKSKESEHPVAVIYELARTRLRLPNEDERIR